MPKNIYTDMIALMGDPESLDDMGAYMGEKDLIKEEEKEVEAEELKVKTERGDI